ncbi:MAG: LysR substrate-binding domain-containing protein [Pseudomonadota bacterium]
MKNLPTDLLRAFVTVVRENGFSSAGKKLGRSQPAVSLQINRLEELVGTPLMVRRSRSFTLTEEGEMLLGYASRILKLNDEVLLKLSRPDVRGKVRLGIPHEFAISYLPGFLTGFAESYPGVELEVISELSSTLLGRLSRDELDLVVAIHRESEQLPSDQGWRESLVWVTDKEHIDFAEDVVRLVVAPKGCVYRFRILQALEEAGIPWRIVYTGTSYGGICAAVRAGLGVTVLAKNTVPEDLKQHISINRLPKLPGANVELHFDEERADAAVMQLAGYINKMRDEVVVL